MAQNPPGELFPANAANKGTGFVAKQEYLAYYTDTFRGLLEGSEDDDSLPAEERRKAALPRLRALLEFYQHPQHIDLRALAGLEIWPGTTSANFRRDPRVSVHFMGMPPPESPNHYVQWQIDCLWEEIGPGDPRYGFGDALRRLTLGHVGRSFAHGHIALKDTPVRDSHPSGWLLWVVGTRNRSIAPGGRSSRQ